LSDKHPFPYVYHAPAGSLRQRVLAAKARVSRRAGLLDFAADRADCDPDGAVHEAAIGNGESRR